MAYLSFIEGRKICTRDYTSLARSHKPTLTKPPHHSLALLDYSMIGCPPKAPALAQVLSSSKIESTISHSFLIMPVPKTLAFLCFHIVQQISITRVSKPFRDFLSIRFLVSVHHCTNLESFVGQRSAVKPTLVVQRNHTCRENMHCSKMGSIVSSS